MQTEQSGARYRRCGGTAGTKRPNVLSGEFLAEPGRRERSRLAREALLRAALSRFAARGYDATTVEDIAKDAGVAVGGFYQHFRSKRQVLLILLDQLLAELEGVSPWAPGDGAAAILACIHHRFTATWQYAGVYRAWREAAMRDSSLTEIQASIEAWTTVKGAAALTAVAAAPGARRNADVPTLSYMLTVIFLRLLESNIRDRTAVADTVVAMVTRALFEDGIPGPDEAARPVTGGG
jgi:AcrR family transcriptional regulator